MGKIQICCDLMSIQVFFNLIKNLVKNANGGKTGKIVWLTLTGIKSIPLYISVGKHTYLGLINFDFNDVEFQATKLDTTFYSKSFDNFL